MNITRETISRMKDLGYIVEAVDYRWNKISFTKGNMLFIYRDLKNGIWDNDDTVFFLTIKTPKKKEVTTDYILSRLDRDSGYKNLSQYLRKVFEYSISIYPASYGIGVDTFGGYKAAAKEVSEKLEELGLKYRTEFSNAGWVYRFIVSKDSDNMKILESLKSA